MSVTLNIVDLWQHYVYCTRSRSVQDRVTRGALVAHRYTYSMCCLAAEPSRTFIALSVSLLNDVGDPIFDGVGLAGFNSRVNVFLLANNNNN